MPPSSRRYTEEEFRAAVADPEVRTIADLCRAIGIVPRGANYESVRAFADELGIDISSLRPRPPYRRLIGDVPGKELRRAIAQSRSLSATLRSLGLRASGSAAKALRNRIDDSGIETAHFRRRPPTRPGSRRTYTDDELRAALTDPTIDGFPALCERLDLGPYSNNRRRLRERASQLGMPIPAEWSRPGPRRRTPVGPFENVDEIRAAIPRSRSIADILRTIGLSPSSRNYRRLHLTVKEYGLDLSGMAPPDQRGGTPRTALEKFLVKGRRCNTSRLRERLLEAGLKEPRCERCRGTEWRGAPIPLELDHVDGDRCNNTRENLRLLCPNCHALTPTYRGRNIGRADDGQATESE